MSYVTAFGIAAQELRDYLADNWQATRPDRPDIPEATTDHRSQRGTVFITNDRSQVNINKGVHDLVHIYHQGTDPVDVEDRGFKEQNVKEHLQIDMEAADWSDPDTGQRSKGRYRLTVDIDDPDFVKTTSKPNYPGELGEMKYLLESVRLGLNEWDVTDHTVVELEHLNSLSFAKIIVTLEHISANTNQ